MSRNTMYNGEEYDNQLWLNYADVLCRIYRYTYYVGAITSIEAFMRGSTN